MITLREVYKQIQGLPRDSLRDLITYIEFLHFRARSARQEVEAHRFRVVARLEGLLEEYPISDEEVAAARREMWAKVGERAL